MDHQIQFELWTIGKRCYVGDFLESLEGATRERVLQKLEDYERYPLQALFRDQKVKKLKSKLYSVRILIRGEYFRFFGDFKGRKMYLVHGFKKKTDKIPSHDISTAESRIKLI